MRRRLALWALALVRWLDASVLPTGAYREIPPVEDIVGPIFTVLRVGGTQGGVIYAGFDGAMARDHFLRIKHGGELGQVQLLHDGMVRDTYNRTG